jgi:hypothetical protein
MENKKKEHHLRSSYFFRVLKGEYNPFRPNRIVISDSFIEQKKRNWHLISVDTSKYHFQNVVGVNVDKHLFGATLVIESTGKGAIKINGLSKKTANKIAELSSEFISANTQKGTTEALAEAIAKATKGSNGGGAISVADELKKMKGLVDDGILSQEEFDEQKAKLMNK